MSAEKKPSPTDPAELLLGAYHRKLLGLLLMHPEQGFHLREIGRLAGVPSGPAHRELKRMQRAGLVNARRVGNQVHYQADQNCPIFEELAGILRKTSGMADVLRDLLAPLADRIDLTFVFGSAAKGEQGPYSDIDVMVVGEVSFEDVVLALQDAHERLRREVNPVVMSPGDFKRKRKQGERFVTRVLAEPKLMLLGELDES